MFGWFTSEPFVDPDLGELRRARGMWRGSLAIGQATIPLALAGSRAAPDPEALTAARSIASTFESWRPSLERALFEHYAPYAEAATAGEADPPVGSLPRIAVPAAVWPHTTHEFIRIAPLEGRLTIEIGYRVAWDEEHTLGARFRDGRFVELCGSVLGLP
jgi:hypothetical protein